MIYPPGFNDTLARRAFPTVKAGGNIRMPVVWMTGLSGAGKSTLANAVSARLFEMKVGNVLLDADELRKTICSDLGYTHADRSENLRRIAYIARQVVLQGEIAIVAAISPYREDRRWARAFLGNFIEVYVNASVQTCMARDPKKLYQRAMAGEIPHFTGIDDPYEAPEYPEIECRTAEDPTGVSVSKILDTISRCHVLRVADL